MGNAGSNNKNTAHVLTKSTVKCNIILDHEEHEQEKGGEHDGKSFVSSVFISIFRAASSRPKKRDNLGLGVLVQLARFLLPLFTHFAAGFPPSPVIVLFVFQNLRLSNLDLD